MNYLELTKLLEVSSLSHPFVNNVLFDKYKVNEEDNLEYPALVYQMTNYSVGNNITNINYNLLYVDRLTRDRCNKLEIQSLGITIITELINAFKRQLDLDITSELDFKVFTNQFADECAGVIATIQISIVSDIGNCEWICLDNNICKECN